ncbi:MAG: hypothetical protein IKX36_00875 [Prevotella sp.]|nr:hypothetical protein [Prevotella sp.]
MKKYIKPQLNERALVDEPILAGSYEEYDEDEDGEYLSNEHYFFYEKENSKHKSVWDN